MNETSLASRERVLERLESYEPLLTERQKQTLDAYYRCDLSFGEIAEESGITRAGVSDAVAKAVNKLEEFEKRLGLVKKKKEWQKRYEDLSASNADMAAYQTLMEDIIHGI